MRNLGLSISILVFSVPVQSPSNGSDRPRPRDLGIEIGDLEPGQNNAITDVAGVRVGHVTQLEGDAVRTGVTVIHPHGGNVFQEKLPAAVVVGNGFGKLVGSTQIHELGQLESPIALTNTLNVGKVTDALVAWMLARPGNERVRSINVVVGETNDSKLNDIRGRHVDAEHVERALEIAAAGPVAGGSVGAGTGTVCFGIKGGIGTSSRRVGRHVVGVLVQTNFGGALRVDGRRVPARVLRGDASRDGERREDREEDEHGSCMIVVATDAPLDTHKLRRLAKRALVGMARVGASFSNGSGDYVLAFSTASALRIPHRSESETVGAATVRTDRLTPFFVAAADATEEAILDSLFRATTVASKARTVQALSIDRFRAWWRAK